MVLPARARPVLCLVFDRAGMDMGMSMSMSMKGDVRARVASLVDAGVDWLHVRDRSLEAEALFDFTRDVLAGARAADREARVIVNRRLDVALAAGADGVHLGFDALSVQEARALLGPEQMLGVSCHSVAEVHAASAAGAGYAHLAPLFDPISKPAERPPLGLGAITEAARSGLAVLAQGGIDGGCAGGVIEAGASGIAVTGHVLQAGDPVAAARALRSALSNREGR